MVVAVFPSPISEALIPLWLGAFSIMARLFVWWAISLRLKKGGIPGRSAWFHWISGLFSAEMHSSTDSSTESSS